MNVLSLDFVAFCLGMWWLVWLQLPRLPLRSSKVRVCWSVSAIKLASWLGGSSGGCGEAFHYFGPRSVSTTLIHPGSEFRLDLRRLPPALG